METVLRAALAYVVILGLLRVLGKRDVGEMSAMELILVIFIPEIVAPGILREDHSLTNGAIALATLMTLAFATSALAYRFKRVGRTVEGQPVVLIARGRLLTEAMDRERVSADELAAEVRRAGIGRVEDVEWAVLETGGRVSVIGFAPGQHREPGDTGPARA